MSGHSKWATIKHKKAALDSKRGKVFTRIIKEIMIAARNGGDPDANPRLRTAITAAKGVSMPAENIKRAVMRGSGELDGGTIDEIMFEGYGPGGAAVLVNVATDNRNRTVSEIRHVFSKNGGNMGEPGSVAWMFDRRSSVQIEEDKTNEEQLMNLVLDAGAEDIRNDGGWHIISPVEAHYNILKALEGAGIPSSSAEIGWIPKNPMMISGSSLKAMMRMTDILDEHDDVQSVYSNFDFDEADLEALG